MARNQPYKPFIQPRLFGSDDTSSGSAELFPAIWNASEDLSDPSISVRRLAIECLENSGAARISPLVAYLIASRLNDSDQEIRTHVVKILGGILVPDVHGNLAPEPVLSHLAYYLNNMRTRQIFALIEVLVYNPDLIPQVVSILRICPFAGNHLIEMANSRRTPVDIRRHAIWLIGEVGYLDAIPALERLQIRMETRLTGQQNMPFAPPLGIDDSELLPDVKTTLGLLRSP